MAANSDNDKARRRTMVSLGASVIGFGLVAALLSYYSDTHSFDIVLMMGASHNAFAEAVIFTLAGGGIIAWYTIGPGGSRRDSDDDRLDGPV